MTAATQLRAFALAHSREALRDRRGLTMLLLTFGGLVALLLAMEALFGGGLFGGGEPPAAVGTAGTAAEASATSGGLLRVAIPVIALAGFLSLALVSTAVPLIAARHSGVLRQFGMTPARRAPFLLGHLPVRFGIGILQLLVVLGVASLTEPPPGALPRIAALLFVGLLMLLALGYLLGGVLGDPDRAMQLCYAVPFAVLVTSGALFPFAALPEPWSGILMQSLGYLPTSLLASALSAELGGAPATLPLGWTLLALVGTTLILALVAARSFRWADARDA